MTMKRIVAALTVVVLLTCALAPVFAEKKQGGAVYYINTPNGKSVNFRSKMKIAPDTILCRIPNGNPVWVRTFSHTGNWAKIEYAGKVGYVLGKYLKRTPPIQ